MSASCDGWIKKPVNPITKNVERPTPFLGPNRTGLSSAEGKCLHELVDAQVRRTPNACAVEYEDEQLTYQQLSHRANQIANYLRNVGIGPETPIGICLGRSLDLAVVTLGVLKAGAVCVPLDPNYPKERLEFMLRDVQSPVIFGRATTALKSAVALIDPRDQRVCERGGNAPVSRVVPDDLAYIIYSSGSTGRPKGVMLPHRGLVGYLASVVELFALKPGDRMLQFSSISFDVAIEELFATWIAGATLVMRSDSMSLAGGDFSRWIRDRQITVLDLPTAFWHEWTNEMAELQEPLPESLRLVVVGGEKACINNYRLWARKAGTRIRWINTYGPSEASIAVTWYEPASPADVQAVLPIGRALPHAKVYLLDETLTPVAPGEVGELYLGGPALARGYLRRPDLTAERFIPDALSDDPGARIYKTGDLARFLPDGNIDFIGRHDFQVKIRGFRVELGEIESVLAECPAVAEVAVIAREDEGNKRLIAYVVPVRGTTPEVPELRGWLSNRVPEYMVPADFVILDAMPLTPNAKIDRSALPDPVPYRCRTGAVPPRDDLERQLVRIWEQMFRRAPIGIRDDFFELGGHSLLAARLMHRIEQTQRKCVPMATIFQAPTIEQLARVLRDATTQTSSLVAIQPAGARLPFFCVHGVGGNVLGFRDLSRHLGPDQPFYALQSSGLDGQQPCHRRIEDMAAHYIAEIRRVQPQAPYCLGGFSFGGLVAYEMARQLRAEGEAVSLLALFDTYTTNLKSRTASLVEMLLAGDMGKVALLPRLAKRTVRRTINLLRLPAIVRRVLDANTIAARQYKLRPYAGRITLFRATSKSLRTIQDADAGWSGLVDAVDVIEIDGDHGSILREPQVTVLAKALLDCLNKSVAQPQRAA